MTLEPRLLHLEDPQDERLADYRAIKERDLAGRRHTFIIEGRVVLEAHLRHGLHALRSVLVSDKRLPALADLLAQLPPETPIYVIPHERMVEVVGFNIHRGLLAAGARPAPSAAAQILAQLPPGPATVLVLESLTNTDNVGACFRNAAAFGASAVLLDDRCCDPLYRKALRVSAGHALGLPFNSPGEPMDKLLDALEEAGFTTAALTLSPRSQPLLGQQRAAARLALLLGTEGHGLSPLAHQRAHLHLSIPMAQRVDSLNVATAGAVALFATRHLPGEA